jgi:DNA-binding response OmpR family regulator
MENQPEIRDLSTERIDSATSRDIDPVEWRKYGEQLGLGLFFWTKTEDAVYLNSVLRNWLGEQEHTLNGEGIFWERISRLAQDPAQLREEVGNIWVSYDNPPLIQVPLRNEKAEWLFIQIHYPALSEARSIGYSGFIFKAAQSDRWLMDMVQIFGHLLAPTRLLSAAIQGNLQALSGNLHTWNPDVQDQFLSDARADLDKLVGFLDLGLIYSKTITHSSTYNLPVSLIELLSEIIDEQRITTININVMQLQDGDSLVLNIDRSMVKIALAIVLKEIVKRNPVGKQTDSGLAGDVEGEDRIENNLEISLAQRILTSQGGHFILNTLSAEEGGGIEIEVSLPITLPPRQQESRQDWELIQDRGSGRILLAENQPEYQLRIREALTDLGFRVDLAVDGSAALDMIQTGQPRLVILARNLPGMDGLLVTQGVRRWSTVPIIMISIRSSMEDLLYAYRLGVDDYLQKPFQIEELLAKVRVFLSREELGRSSLTPEIYQDGSIRIDYANRQVWVRGDLVQLTPIEFNLLGYLSRQGRQIIPYEQLLEHVWDGPEKGTRQGLFVHVKRLREKIEEEPSNPEILSNKWGVGYVFNP